MFLVHFILTILIFFSLWIFNSLIRNINLKIFQYFNCKQLQISIINQYFFQLNYSEIESLKSQEHG